MQTLLEAFLNMSLRSIHFTEEQFSGTSKTPSLRTTLLKCWINRIPKLLNIWSKEFCCTLMMVKYPFPALLHSFLPIVHSYGRGNRTTPHMQLHNPLRATAHSKCTSHIKAPHCLYIRDGQNPHLQHEGLQSINDYNYYVNKVNIIL